MENVERNAGFHIFIPCSRILLVEIFSTMEKCLWATLSFSEVAKAFRLEILFKVEKFIFPSVFYYHQVAKVFSKDFPKVEIGANNYPFPI